MATCHQGRRAGSAGAGREISGSVGTNRLKEIVRWPGKLRISEIRLRAQCITLAATKWLRAMGKKFPLCVLYFAKIKIGFPPWQVLFLSS